MEDIQATLSQILSDPQKMQQIQQMMQGLSGGNQTQPANQPIQPEAGQQVAAPDFSALSGMLSSLASPAPQQNIQQNSGAAPDMSQISNLLSSFSQQQAAPTAAAPTAAMPNLDMINMMTKLTPMIQQMQTEDDSTRLLRALRPLLSEAKQQRLDQSLRILQLMRLAPLIKETGLFKGI